MDLKGRVLELERELKSIKEARRRRHGAVVLALCAGLFSGLAAAWLVGGRALAKDEWGSGEATTKPSVLTDDKGKKRAELTMMKGGPALAFYDGGGKARLLIGLRGDEPGMMFMSEKGRATMELYTSKGKSRLAFLDKEGNRRARLDVRANEVGMILSDAKTKASVEIYVDNRRPRLRLRDENGKTVWTAPEAR